MLSVAASVSVCQRKEHSCQDVIIPHPTPPPCSWRRCHVECGRKCVRGRNAAARTLFSHPTPPHPPASGDDAMLTVAASVTRMLVSESRGWWLRNRLFLVSKSSFFGCGIVLFWLRNRLFLVAEACLILVAESPKFGCGSVEIWFRNRNLFSLGHTTPSQTTLSHATLSHTTFSHTHNLLTHTTPSHTHTVAGVALGDIQCPLAWQAWHSATWTWNSAWQAWHLWRWAGSRGGLGSRLSPWTPRLFAWQAWHLAI